MALLFSFALRSTSVFVCGRSATATERSESRGERLNARRQTGADRQRDLGEYACFGTRCCSPVVSRESRGRRLRRQLLAPTRPDNYDNSLTRRSLYLSAFVSDCESERDGRVPLFSSRARCSSRALSFQFAIRYPLLLAANKQTVGRLATAHLFAAPSECTSRGKRASRLVPSAQDVRETNGSRRDERAVHVLADFRSARPSPTPTPTASPSPSQRQRLRRRACT